MIFIEECCIKLYDFLYHPKKPEEIEKRKAYILVGDIAELAAVVFTVETSVRTPQKAVYG